MAAQVPEFEYDVFISYRQNDNKPDLAMGGEGWVTSFVTLLATELQATVKDQVSIYFDKNPHDGLLDTHIVEESLAGKLRSLLFIPIISQTYCDVNSYAWQNEFLLFSRNAQQDKFGANVKLLNGNVASRVLPIRIHELEAADIKLLEDELKTKLRPIDFIFKSAGVNRPLRFNEVDPLKNIYRTTYHDQINRTANVIKDLLNGLKSFEIKATKAGVRPKPSITKDLELGINTHAIAVLPFVDGSKVTRDFLGESVAEELITLLSPIRNLKIAPRVSAFQFSGNESRTQMIGAQLNVSKVIKGTIIADSKVVEITLDCLDVRSGKSLWSMKEKGTERSKVLRATCLGVIKKMNLKPREQELGYINQVPTANEEAYLSYLEAKYYSHRQGEALRKALTFFTKAATQDPNFAMAQSGLSECYILLGFYDLLPFQEAVSHSKATALKALQLNPLLMDAFVSLSFVAMCYEWSWSEIEQVFSKVFAQNPTSPSAKERLIRYRDQIDAHLIEAESEPLTGKPYYLQAFSYLHRGLFEDALKVALQAQEADPESYMANRAVGLSYMGLEKYDEAIDALLTASRLSNRKQGLLFELMAAYSFSGKLEETHAIAEEAMATANALPARVYNFFFPSI